MSSNNTRNPHHNRWGGKNNTWGNRNKKKTSNTEWNNTLINKFIFCAHARTDAGVLERRQAERT